jgi:hypothetical protein
MEFQTTDPDSRIGRQKVAKASIKTFGSFDEKDLRMRPPTRLAFAMMERQCREKDRVGASRKPRSLIVGESDCGRRKPRRLSGGREPGP